MQQINSPGFERWAKIFNLKELAKTVMYLQENGLTDLGELEKVCDATVQKFNDLADQTKAANARMKDISELQRHISTYSKTREVYVQYRKLTGRKQAKFYEQHSSEIMACQAAKRYFDSLSLKKPPSMQSLKQEYAMLQAGNKKRYPEYKQTKAKMIELLTAKKATWKGKSASGGAGCRDKLRCLTNNRVLAQPVRKNSLLTGLICYTHFHAAKIMLSFFILGLDTYLQVCRYCSPLLLTGSQKSFLVQSALRI